MLKGSSLLAFIATTDTGRARRFYEGVLGLQVLYEDAHALVVDGLGAPLRIQKVANLVPQPHTILGWAVASIDDAVKALEVRGIGFERYAALQQDPHGIWSSPGGAKVAWFKDPDGNLLSLSELHRSPE